MFPTEARQLDIKENSSIRNALDVAVNFHGKYDLQKMLKNELKVITPINKIEIKHLSRVK